MGKHRKHSGIKQACSYFKCQVHNNNNNNKNNNKLHSTVKKSDCHWNKRPVGALCLALRVSESVAMETVQCPLPCRESEELSTIDVSLANILLSSTSSTKARGPPRTELPFLNSLLSFFLWTGADFGPSCTWHHCLSDQFRLLLR